MSRGRILHALAAAFVAVPIAACGGRIKVDLDPARAAVAEAREASAPTRSPEAFKRAESDLQRAEALAAGREVRRDRRGAQRAADLAVAEAHCATALSRSVHDVEQVTSKAAAAAAANT